LALGAFLDGLPEQLVLGLGIALGDGVSPGLLGAIFVSNLPEAIGSATAMHGAGRSRREMIRLWVGVAVICTLALGVRIRDRRHRLGHPQGRNQRLRCRGPGGDAGRLDDPRGDTAGGSHDRVDHHPRLRGRRRDVGT